MNLAIDIGNTRVKTGIYSNNKLLESNSYEAFDTNTLRKIIKDNPLITNTIVCSVKKYPAEWKKFLAAKTNFHELTAFSLTNYHLPLTITYKTPKTLGMDRLASAFGAQSINKNSNILIINAGTCITYDFLDSKGVYRGGSISPGVDMRYKALHTFTGQLPLLKQDIKMKKLTGTTTNEAIQSGIQQGIIKEVEGIIKSYQAKYPDIKVVMTGGNMPWLLKQVQHKLLKSLKIKINAQPFLLLTGLNVILSFFHNT